MMTDSANPNPINSIDGYETAAQETVDQLSKANSRSTIRDKASKNLKQSLATLAKARTDAEAEMTLASQLYASLKDSYDSDASAFVKQIRASVESKIAELREKMPTQETLNTAKTAAAQAKLAFDESNVRFEEAQKKLSGLPKEIQDVQKQLATLRAEATDAHNKHQLVEAVVKLEDIQATNTDLNKKANSDGDLWKEFINADEDLIKKAEDLVDAQAKVRNIEAEINKVKAALDEAQKSRMDQIRKRVADKDPARSAR